ncbi:MAG: hypothetical protein ACXWU2_00175 [Allosphingosinicella sp.]
MTQDHTHFSSDELWVDAAGGDPVSRPPCLSARDKEIVDRFHAAGLAAGGPDHGGSGERPYRPGYYAACLLDPDGNNIEVVRHVPVRRSAEAVDFTPEARQ